MEGVPSPIGHLWIPMRAMMYKNLLVASRSLAALTGRLVMETVVLLILVLAVLQFQRSGGAAIGGGAAGLDSIAIMLYGVILFLFAYDAIFTIGYNMRLEQIEGTLESLTLAPVGHLQYLVSRLVEPVIWTGLTAVALVGSARLILGPLPASHLGPAVVIGLLTVSALFGFGFAYAAFTLLARDAAQVAGNLLFLVLVILCGTLVPFRVLPGPVLAVSRLIPFSYGVDLFRSSLLGLPAGTPELASSGTEWLIVVLSGVLIPLAGCGLYVVVKSHLQNQGMLTR